MKSEDSMITKTRRSYTEAFKEEAVRLVRESGHPVVQVARDLGIADHLLYRWRAEQQQAEGRGQTRQLLRGEQAELARLRRGRIVAEQAPDPVTHAAQRRINWRRLRRHGRSSGELIHEARIAIDRLAADGLLHELAHHRQRTAGTLAPVIAAQGYPAIIEARPCAGHHTRMHEDEPAVGVVLRGAGLARHIGLDAVA